jgi:hypothetical protein
MPGIDVGKRILTQELGPRKINFGWIPRKLATKSNAAPVAISRQLLTFRDLCSEQKLCDILTEGETWIDADNPRSSMWVSADIERPTRVRHTISQKKFIFWICFSCTGAFNVVTLVRRSYQTASSTVSPGSVIGRLLAILSHQDHGGGILLPGHQ